MGSLLGRGRGGRMRLNATIETISFSLFGLDPRPGFTSLMSFGEMAGFWKQTNPYKPSWTFHYFAGDGRAIFLPGISGLPTDRTFSPINRASVGFPPYVFVWGKLVLEKFSEGPHLFGRAQVQSETTRSIIPK